MTTRNYTVIYRILHWAMAFCFVAILFTIFLRSTWLNKDNVSQIIQNYFATTDLTLSKEQAIKLAKQIRKPMWEWHIYFGYILVGLYSIRMIIPLFGEMKFTNPLNKELSIKEKFQYSVYLIFYICVGISLVTGLLMMFGSKNLGKPSEEIHVLSTYYLLSFMIIHLLGVFIAELTTQRGLISKMISGDVMRD